MSGPVDGPHDPPRAHEPPDDEVDPTGIRALLAGLPDPGPMPDDLVRRIEARLEVEQTAREQESSRPLGRHADRVVDLAAERGRRRPGRTLAWLGAVAAGLVVTAAVVPQLVDGLGGNGGADTAAYYPSAQRDADDDAGAGSEAGDGTDGGEAGGALDQPGTASDDETVAGEALDDEDAGSGPPEALWGLGGELVLLPDLGLVETGTLTQSLVLAVEEQDAAGTAPPRLSGVLTEGEAVSCWRELADTHSFDRYVAAPARAVLPEGQREGEPVVALLGLDDDGAASSWILPHGCTQQPGLAPVGEGQPQD